MHPLKQGCGEREKQYKPDRLEYLNQLLIEFQTSNSKDAKEQVLANLANFAYDPLNYNHFRTLNILDFFLENLTSREEVITRFSAAGLCNLCLDPLNKEYIFKNGLNSLKILLNNGSDETKLSVISILIFLITPISKPEITSTEVIKSMIKLVQDQNPRIKNLAKIFLTDYCTQEQIEKAGSQSDNLSVAHAIDTLANIPLPES